MAKPDTWPPPGLVPDDWPRYMTDGRQLVEILETDRSGALGEDVKTELLVPIDASEVCKAGDPPERLCWRPVVPLETPPEQEREWLLTF